MLRREDDPRRLQGCVTIWYQDCHDGCVIMISEAKHLSRVANLTSTIVHQYASFIDLLISMMSYTHAFEKEYRVRFFDDRINCVVDDIVSSNFLLSDSCSSHVRYISLTRLALKYGNLLSVQKHLSVKGVISTTFGVTLDNNGTLSHAWEEDTMLTIRAADCYMKNTGKPLPSRSLLFYKLSTISGIGLLDASQELSGASVG